MPSRDSASRAAAWRVQEPGAYAYLLGSYLGDGHINHKPPGAWTLLISCDRAYPGIEREVAAAMLATFPDAAPGLRQLPKGSVDVVSVTHPAVGRAFPQHGPGRKHLRSIKLEGWQLEITRAHPGALIRGLIHSDGCRCVNRFRTQLPSGRVAEYAYVRYFFSNLSEDIRRVFTEHCHLLGIRVTQPNSRNLAVSHRASVAVLEELVGMKS